MSLTNCYITLEDVKSRLGGQVDARYDAVIEERITSACRAIDVFCGQSFYDVGSATAREFAVTDELWLHTPPFSTTTGLIVKTDDDDDGVYETTWSASDYELIRFDPSYVITSTPPYVKIRAVGSRLFPRYADRQMVVQVTARWGWSAVPQAVKEAAEILSSDLWARRNAPLGITQSTVEFGGMRIGRDLFAQVADMLRNFRRFELTYGIA